MKVLFKLFGLLWLSYSAHAGLIYGVDQVENQSRRVHYPAYVQVGSFLTVHTAKRLQNHIQVSTKLPVVIQSSSGRYKVRVGPFHNQSSLNSFASNMAKGAHKTHSKQQPSSGLLKTPRSRPAPSPLLKPMQAPENKKHVLSKQRTTPAYAVQQGSHRELSVFLGGSYIPNTIKGQTLQLLPYEIDQYADTFVHQSSANAFTWGVDALYRFKLHAPSIENYFFDSIGTGIDVFQITNFTQTGDVLQFGLPEFENYTYALKLNNLRVMAKIDLDFYPIQHYFIPFVQAGIGGARTTISYNSAPIPPVDGSNFTLPNAASWHFAYQAGAGIKYVAKTHLVLSLRYLYADMGKVNSSTWGSSTTLATPLTVKMNTQNVLFGLTYLME